MAELVTLDEAQRLVLERVTALPAETVRTAEAAGRVLAVDGLATVDLPPFASSAMDGFAVSAADVPGRLPVVDSSAAGKPAARELRAGEAIAISTGAVVPAGADAVVPVEYVVQHDNNTVEIRERVAAGANVRPRGGDLAAGGVVVPQGVRLGAAAIGALSAAGLPELRCGARPRVAVLATGTELVPPGRELGAGQVYEANTAMLAAAVTAAGGLPEVIPFVEDSVEAHRRALELGLAADVLVTSGGVSVGVHDLVRQVEAKLGVEEVFWRVAVKPGKPVSFGVRGQTLVFGLPGNPVSSLVAFVLFVQPALLALQGAADPLPRFELGTLTSAVRRNAKRDEFLRARSRLEGAELLLEPLTGQESHMIGRAALADALVHAPLGDGELAAGARVAFLPLR